MSEIRFITAQGDLLDAAIAKAPSRQPRAAGRWLQRLLRPRKRAAAVVVALVVAGCGVAAATGAFSASSARLAAGTVNCYYGTGLTSARAKTPHRSDALIQDLSLIAGQSPTQACRVHLEASNGYTPADLRGFGLVPVHDPKFIACVKTPTSTSVFISSGKADQCRELGLKPLPHSFAAASASVQSLASQLSKLYLSRNCWAPNAFVSEARATVENNGFTGWRVVLEKPHPPSKASAAILGRCGGFAGVDANASLDGDNRTLDLSLATPLSTNRFVSRAESQIGSKQETVCYRASTIRTVVEKAFLSSGMTPKIAITTNPNGGKGFSWGTRAEARHYQKGCLNLVDVEPATNDKTAYVWFMSRYGTYIRPNATFEPPIRDFHS
jgi:hypothetical protein